MEKILIQNFGGVSKLEIELRTINIFIGKQSSGKSVTAKLLYFFKNVPNYIREHAVNERSQTSFMQFLKDKFYSYFPVHTWSRREFKIVYSFESNKIEVNCFDNNLKIKLSKKYLAFYKEIMFKVKMEDASSDNLILSESNKQIYEYRDSLLYAETELGKNSSFSQIFIPAGRSFYSNIQTSIFSILSMNGFVDPFLIEFGSFYERTKGILDRYRTSLPFEKTIDLAIQNIIGASFKRSGGKDWLLHKDKRFVNMPFASSGQQEALPLLLTLKAVGSLSFYGNGTTTYIEEPEAHLFPDSQQRVVEMLAIIQNTKEVNSQFIITTHSPYVLTSFNNLMMASIAYHTATNEKNKRKVLSIVSQELFVDTKSVSAYSFDKKSAESIVDSKTRLIDGKYLDRVSDSLNNVFDNLLSVNF